MIPDAPSTHYTSGSVHELEEMLKRKRRAVLAKKGVLLQDFYTRKELARALGFSIVTIARMDANGTGPPGLKLGGVRLYRKTAVQEWLERAVREAEGQPIRTRPEKKK
jgi:predicted DNA-binding transcriptional regulator AlpA